MTFLYQAYYLDIYYEFYALLKDSYIKDAFS